ncbi:hypothetical protein KY348_03495 [Candidatus Woesearchaeota archaeon]|nr:hypothetical protein [Candidatus Woesearchaeota archaeon]
MGEIEEKNEIEEKVEVKIDRIILIGKKKMNKIISNNLLVSIVAQRGYIFEQVKITHPFPLEINLDIWSLKTFCLDAHYLRVNNTRLSQL